MDETKNGEALAKTEENELSRLNVTLDRLFNDKRRLLIDTIARHNEERTAVTNDYVRRMEDLKYQAEEAMRTLEKQQTAEIEPINVLVRRLEEIRG